MMIDNDVECMACRYLWCWTCTSLFLSGPYVAANKIWKKKLIWWAHTEAKAMILYLRKWFC